MARRAGRIEAYELHANGQQRLRFRTTGAAFSRHECCDKEEHVSRFLLALIRNCGVAIAISVFFAAARTPSHPPRLSAIDVLAAVPARNP
jgi:hypothetical protein